MPALSDPAAERAVLAGVCEYGTDIFLDICDIVKTNTFNIRSNQCIWKCLEHILKNANTNINSVDLPSILSAAQELGLTHIVERTEEAKHLNSILKLHVNKDNIRKFAGKIRKLEIARLIYQKGDTLKEKMLEVQGTEPIAQILAIAEDVVFDFTSLMDDPDSNPTKLGSDVEEYIKYLEQNPVQQMGISTGFPNYDRVIGGGLRDATLNVIGARPKQGKTILSDNMGYYIAKNSEIPVLNLDTEMLKEDHQHRTLALLSGVSINDIETGQFGQDPIKREKVYKAAKELDSVPYYHKSIAGMPFEDQLSLMRRWVQKEVGLNPDGTSKECVIIYDYLKLMESTGISDALREFQILGFMMTALHNFAVRYKKVRFLIFMQLNRDGIDRENTDVASGSDRIIWLCSNFTIFKRKSEEEVAEDGPLAGNRKLVILAARHGQEVQFGDYINCHMEGWKAKVTEGKWKSELGQDNVDGFEVEDDDDGIPFE